MLIDKLQSVIFDLFFVSNERRAWRIKNALQIESFGKYVTCSANAFGQDKICNKQWFGSEIQG